MIKNRSLLVCILLLLALAWAAPPVSAQSGDRGKVVVGQSYTLHTGERLDGDLAVLGGSATIENDAVAAGNVAVAGGTLSVAGHIMGDVAVFGGTTKLDAGAEIEGNLAVFGGTIDKSPDAVIHGQVFNGLGVSPFGLTDGAAVPAAPTPPNPLRALFNYMLRVLGAVGLALALAAIGLLAVILFPNETERVANTVAVSPLVTFGVGLLSALVIAGLAIILAITICLAPVAVLVALAGLMAWLLGWIAVGWLVGRRLLQSVKLHSVGPLLEVILGVFLLTFLWRVVPCLGGFFWLVISGLGLGSVVLTRFGTQPYNGSPATVPLLPAAPPRAAVTPYTAPELRTAADAEPAGAPDVIVTPPPYDPPQLEKRPQDSD